jgi:hypothetical protein
LQRSLFSCCPKPLYFFAVLPVSFIFPSVTLSSDNPLSSNAARPSHTNAPSEKIRRFAVFLKIVFQFGVAIVIVEKPEPTICFSPQSRVFLVCVVSQTKDHFGFRCVLCLCS